MTTEVSVAQTSAQTVATWRTQTTHTSIFNDIPMGLGRVVGHLTEAGIDPAGLPFTLYHQAPDGDTIGDIAVAIPVTPGTETGADGDIVIVDMPAQVEAAVLHVGSYDNMGESYAAVVGWIHQHGHNIVGPSREIYLNSPHDAAEHELRTQILFPIDAEVN